MNRDEFYRSIRELLCPEAMQSRTVCIVGLGSGGSRVAESLARNGVGCLLLVERPGETMEEHNIVRHTLDYRSLGRLKTEAMRERLIAIRPDCRIHTAELDVVTETTALYDLVKDVRADLLLACTDTESSRHALNQVAIRTGTPMIFASVFTGGIGGHVGRCEAGAACYACPRGTPQNQPPGDGSKPARVGGLQSACTTTPPFHHRASPSGLACANSWVRM